MLDRVLISLLLITAAAGAYALWQRRFMQHASAVTVRRGQATILYFRSDSCAPCAAQWRFLQQVEAEFQGQVAVEKIDADIRPDVAKRYGVFSLPTTLVVDATGVVRHANYGLAPTRKLATQLHDVANGG
jgi:thioredoxin-like negative regulator of GroEL